ncbi:MAG: hypothetical protein IPM88_20385 [Nitrospira sp.]|nr:hypothetical protein [Nitrospira sp.]
MTSRIFCLEGQYPLAFPAVRQPVVGRRDHRLLERTVGASVYDAGEEDRQGVAVALNTTFTKAAKKGERVITVKNAAQYHPEIEILIGADNVGGNEVGRIKSIKGTRSPGSSLKNDHPVKDIVTVEFVRQRFWVDSDVGTVFWHDHALGRITWGHGGFGTMIVEPVGSTYHNPKTGAPIRSGPLADIRTAEPVGYGVNGSFRELMVQLNDSVPHTINIVTAGNPPGQPVEIALEAGKTISFPIPDHIKMTPMPFLNGGRIRPAAASTSGRSRFPNRMAANPDMSSSSAAPCTAIRIRRWYARTWAIRSSSGCCRP